MRNKFRILVAEDNQSMREGIRTSLRREGYWIDTAIDGEQAWNQLQSAHYQLLITDIKMPNMDGLELFRRVKADQPATVVILITAFATVDIAVDALKQGADDFITKPFANAELRSKVHDQFQKWALQQNLETGKIEDSAVIGESEPIRKIKALIEKVANVDSAVLITGESGTGKELVALSIHSKSPNASGPFVAVNCGALSESLLESELFGHEKGAFTGAVRSHAGKFEQAHSGTLFLDEIGDMSPGLQVKLLRVLQNKKFQRVGAEEYIRSDFRLIAATNKNLPSEVEQGNFRSDLYYRLNVIPIHLPPLRERRDDIPLIAMYILARKAKKLERKPPEIDQQFMRKLQSYSWPGNIRELENFIERALVFTDEDVLNDRLFAFSENGTDSNSGTPSMPSDLIGHIEKIEREILVNALRENRGIKQRTAQSLKIKTSTLYYKIEKYKIQSDEYE